MNDDRIPLDTCLSLPWTEIPILYLDNHLLIVKKPHGLLVQGDHTGDITLLDIAKDYLKKRFNKPGNVFLGMIHRLDRPAAGVVIFARTSKAASRLSEQFRKKQIRKTYITWVQGKTPTNGKLDDWITRKGPTSQIVDKSIGKHAKLTYHQIIHHHGQSLLKVDLETGRHHQIRLQLANQGFPILGDFRYGSKTPFPHRSIALLCKRIECEHPTKKTEMIIDTRPDEFWPEVPVQY